MTVLSTAALTARTATSAPSSPNDATATPSLTNEMAPNTVLHVAPLYTKTTTATTANIMDANIANDATHVDTATVTSSDDATSQPPLFTYTHEEVQVLLDEARLEGWEEGMEEGLKIGKERMLENGQKMHEKGRRIGYRLGMKDSLDEGEKKMVGHGEGLCISKEAHIRELW